ncbi:MAG: serine/threonine protein kinase [Myxococcales bacterium]|nr:serine/threonine protein kinase [Myxococcales bacterium]
MSAPPELQKRSLLVRQLREERRTRDRSGLHINLWLCVVAALALQLTVNKDAKHWLLTLTVALNAVVTAVVLRLTPRDKQVDPWWIVVLALLSTAATLAAIVQLGLLSPVTALLPVIIFYHSMDDSAFIARIAYASTAVGYLLLAILSLAGALPLTDSVIAISKENPRAIVGFTIMLEALFFGTYVMARRNRQATRAVMDRLEQASRQVVQGDALLTEARAELRRALTGAKLGRWSGERLSGYALEDVIGRGGMADVYAARHAEDGSRVAVKVLHSHFVGDAEQVTRFLREAAAAAALVSPHVVRVLHADRAPDGTPYLVTELLLGRDLAAILRDEGRLDMAAIAELLTQVGRGLEVAWQAGIVHRDLKPNNVFRAESEGVPALWKVLDFGVASISSGSSELTRGQAVGTPSYMSPEQARGEAVDHRADVFALGAIAYRALTGQPAFTGADPTSTLYQVVHVQPVRPSLLSDASPDVDRVLALGLAKDRERRLDSAVTLAQAFRDAVRGELSTPLRQAADALLAAEPWAAPVADSASSLTARR